MGFSFLKTPFSGLILRWQSKLESATSQAYVDLVKMLDEKETNLKNLFDRLLAGSGSQGKVEIGDPTVDGSWQIIIDGANLKHQKRVSGAWVTKDTISG